MPAVITHTVNTTADDPDNNIGNGIVQTAAGQVSLRAVLDEVNNSGNATDTYVIDLLFPPQAVILGQPPPPPPTLTIPLASQLPDVIADRHYKIVGTPDRRVTLTRDPNAQPNDYYRFLNVVLDGTLEVSGLRLTGAVNRNSNGGAINNDVGGTLVVENCFFDGNLSAQGGAIENAGALTVATTPAGGTKTEFSQNTSLGFGGAIHTGAVGTDCVAVINDSVFTNNAAGVDNTGFRGRHKGGAIASNIGGTLSVAGCTFLANQAEVGGAIYADAPLAATAPPGSLTFSVTNSVFESNRANQPPGGAPGLAKGGAIYSGGNNAGMTGCTFRSNVSDQDGGAIYQERGVVGAGHLHVPEQHRQWAAGQS